MRKLSFLLLLFILGGCNSAPRNKQLKNLQYFDLKGFIAEEAARLNRQKSEIDKSVTINQSSEQKKVKIADWQKELSVFADADINKSAWQGLFSLQEKRDTKVYLSDNEKVPVKSLTIKYKNGKPAGIQILISTKNMLYTSSDTLCYYPDSIYQVKKSQQIKLLNKKEYRVNGIFPNQAKNYSF